jgi:alpha-tubulin suppressor-like RCC1 family protein
MGDRSFVPVQVAGLSDVVRLSGGASHICALVEDGTVWCWGRSARGEIGNGTIGVSDVPVKVEGLSDVRDISAGSDHTCAALDDGTVWCWGDNIEGQIGNGTESLEVVATPTRVPGLDSVRSLDASDRTTRSLLEDTTVRCWGSGRSGELGNGVSGANYRSYVPVPVLDLTGVVQMTLASGRGCAVLDDGTARCWGNDSQGRLGKGTIGQHSSVPIEVSGLVGAVQIAGSPFAAHSCARLGSGGLRCWGHNVHGQVGNGLYGWEHSAPSPVAVSRFY